MNERVNQFGQTIGRALPGYTPGDFPKFKKLEGKRCYLEPLCSSRLQKAVAKCYLAMKEPDWTYLSVGPFASLNECEDLVSDFAASKDPCHIVIARRGTDEVLGTFSLMRIQRENRSIEMGWVIYSDLLKHRTEATEAQYLAMRYVFDTLKYRRYEWKCDALNAPSASAAQRLGFSFEGLFRNAAVYKGRSRGTKWFSVTDNDWPEIKKAFEQYLDERNFDAQGRQLKPLQARRPGHAGI